MIPTFFTRALRAALSLWQRAYMRLPLLPHFLSVGAVVLVCAYALFFAPPRDFPRGEFVSIERGESIDAIAATLAQERIIRSPSTFTLIANLTASDTTLRAGDYYFGEPVTLITLLSRMARGDYGYEPIKLTIPEGATVKEIGTLARRVLPHFDTTNFLALAKEKEGYLFPDTYFFSPRATEEDLVSVMEERFASATTGLRVLAVAQGKDFHSIVTMASLLEEEARELADRKRIAGILWQRIESGIPLQVDAVFPYIIGRNTFQVTLADLKNPSPYNTYVHKGLPPGPISNPGIDSLEAALDPTPSPYFYYLSDRSGNLYYAKTFEEHKQNRQKYL